MTNKTSGMSAGNKLKLSSKSPWISARKERCVPQAGHSIPNCCFQEQGIKLYRY